MTKKIIFYDEADEITEEVFQNLSKIQTTGKEIINTLSTKVTKNKFWATQLIPKNKK